VVLKFNLNLREVILFYNKKALEFMRILAFQKRLKLIYKRGDIYAIILHILVRNMYSRLRSKSFIKLKPNEKMLSIYIDYVRANIVVNESAYEILQYCDGTNTLSDIISMLSEKYENCDLQIKNFIEEYLNKGIIEYVKEKSKVSIIKGSNEIYFPDTLSWEITDVCPLDCQHCYLGKKTGRAMKLDEVDMMLDIIEKTGVTNVQLTGGEVFTCSYVSYIVNRLNELGIMIVISTTGYILNNEVKKVLASLKKYDNVKVSLDGDMEFHNTLRRNSEAYQRCILFMDYLSENNINFQVGTVVCNQSQEMIREVIRTAKNLGASLIDITDVLEEGNALYNDKKCLYSHSELVDKMIVWDKEFTDEHFRVSLPQKGDMINCGAGYKLIYVKSNLTVTPCPMISYSLGSIRLESYTEIAMRGTEIFSNIYSPKCTKQNTCEKCAYEKECGDCMAIAFVRGKEKDECAWLNKNSNVLKSLDMGV